MSIEQLAILRSFLLTRLRRFASRDQLESWQNRKVQKFVRRTLTRSQFYREQFAAKGIAPEDWRACPLMTRELFMANFDAINTRGVKLFEAMSLCQASEASRDFTGSLGDLTVGMSSGTSGKASSRGVFLVSDRERAHGGIAFDDFRQQRRFGAQWNLHLCVVLTAFCQCRLNGLYINMPLCGVVHSFSQLRAGGDFHSL